jgi:hypothetical protein
MGKSLEKRLRARKEELAKKGGNGQFFFFKEGTHRMRILPAPPEEEFAVEAIYFFINKEIGGIISPATFGEPCALMKAYLKLKESPKDEDKEMAKNIAPRKRYFIAMYKYKDEKGKKIDKESGVRLAILTNQQYTDVIDLYLDDEAGDMTDPKEGYDLKFKRTGAGQYDTEYTTLRCNPTPIAKEFKGKIHNPITMVKKVMPSYEETLEMVKKILGTSGKKKKSSKEDNKTKLKKKIKTNK